MRFSTMLFLAIGLVAASGFASAGDNDTARDQTRFMPLDVFELEYAADPQVSPDGKHILYLRTSMDIMTDRKVTNLWMVKSDGSSNRPLMESPGGLRSPRWSPQGDRIVYVAGVKGRKPQLFLRYLDTGQSVRLTNLTESPRNPVWSPDGKYIAFTMRVPEKPSKGAKLPPKPKGAEWAPAVKVIDDVKYRADGAGYLPSGVGHIFLVSASGGTPRQLTFSDKNHGGEVSFSPDGKHLVFSGNLNDDSEYDPMESEVYRLTIADGEITALTDRDGPDGSPKYSPNGKWIAYTGFDDEGKGFHTSRLHIMRADGSDKRVLTEDLDRSIGNIQWAGDGNAIFGTFNDRGKTVLAEVSIGGRVNRLTDNLGGTSLGRPYTSGDYSVSNSGRYAWLGSRMDRPADLFASGFLTGPRQLTRLNDDLVDHKSMGNVEEVWYKSSFDGRDIQGWIVTPPDFEPSKKYPLILEIHGGPFAAYGPHFSAEVQLFAEAGYVVLYTNPRGSTSYGNEFANLIHHNYPSQDYDDLMSGVDAVIAKGYIDEKRLFVTGGSGGGVLTSWIVGKTDRFAAAVVAKPVINWISFSLTADSYPFFYKYWFGKFPWEAPEEYWARSPLSLVGNVKTPTMLLTGEADYRTPMSETEQYYQALQLLKVDTAMVRIPDASHGIAARPSHLLAKVANILDWFEKYDVKEDEKAE